jgi:hypothetical protein
MTFHLTNEINMLKFVFVSVYALRFTYRTTVTDRDIPIFNVTDTDTLQIPCFAYGHGHVSVSVLGPTHQYRAGSPSSSFLSINNNNRALNVCNTVTYYRNIRTIIV